MAQISANDPMIVKVLYLHREKNLNGAEIAKKLNMPKSTVYNMRRMLHDAGHIKNDRQRQQQVTYKLGPVAEKILSWEPAMIAWFCEQWPDEMSFFDFISSFVLDAFHEEGASS